MDYSDIDQCVERYLLRVSYDGSPEILASLSLAQVRACANAVGNASCGELREVMDGPACLYSGHLANGAACDYDIQCASAYCENGGFYDEHGSCVERVREGASCADRWHGCAAGLWCNDSDICAVPEPDAKLGEECDEYDDPLVIVVGKDCQYGLRCVEGRCAGAPMDGEKCSLSDWDPCVGLLQCVPGTSSEPDEGVCQQPMMVGPGEACESMGSLCQAGLYCDDYGGDGLCHSFTRDGAPCTKDWECLPPAECADGLCQMFGDEDLLQCN
jgi:hypothetical protein